MAFINTQFSTASISPSPSPTRIGSDGATTVRSPNSDVKFAFYQTLARTLVHISAIEQSDAINGKQMILRIKILTPEALAQEKMLKLKKMVHNVGYLVVGQVLSPQSNNNAQTARAPKTVLLPKNLYNAAQTVIQQARVKEGLTQNTINQPEDDVLVINDQLQKQSVDIDDVCAQVRMEHIDPDFPGIMSYHVDDAPNKIGRMNESDEKETNQMMLKMIADNQLVQAQAASKLQALEKEERAFAKIVDTINHKTIPPEEIPQPTGPAQKRPKASSKGCTIL